MGEQPAAAAPAPCCVCAEPGGKHCTKCKSRHYCSKECQLVDWNDRRHKAQCKQMAADFQDRLLDSMMPAKRKIKEAPPIVEGVSPADVAEARLPAFRAPTTATAVASNADVPDWRGICAICLDLLPLRGAGRTFYDCCCKKICLTCSQSCLRQNDRCPLCRTPAAKSFAEALKRVRKHADKGNAEAQVQLGNAYQGNVEQIGHTGLKKCPKRASELYALAAAQGHAGAQNNLGTCFLRGNGVAVDHEAAVSWFQRAAEQGHPKAQYDLGGAFYHGKGVAQSHDEAMRWWRLAAAQGDAGALYNLGACHQNGKGVPQDLDEALCCFERAAAEGDASAAETLEQLRAWLEEEEQAGSSMESAEAPRDWPAKAKICLLAVILVVALWWMT